MGMFNWFSKKTPANKPAEPVSKPPMPELSVPHPILKFPKPDKLIPTGENSPMVAFGHNKTLIMMDRDAYDYTYGPVVGINPTQLDVEQLFRQVNLVCVLEGSMFQGKAMTSKVLATITDPSAIQSLEKALQIIEDPSTFDHCHCLGGPTLECYAGTLLLATISLQHGQAIRWKRWHPDARLQDGSLLTQWLIDQGIEKSLLDSIYTRGNNHLMTKSPPNAEYLTVLGQAGAKAKQMHQEGRLAEFLPEVTSLIERYPDQCEPYSLRADILDYLGRTQDLFADANTAIKLGMRQSITFFQRARCLGLQGQWAEAAADCSNALAFKPECPEIMTFRGNCLALTSQPQQALQDWARAIELAPDWAMPRLLSCQILHRLGQMDEALKGINEAIAICQNDAPRSEGLSMRQPSLAHLYLERGEIRHDFFQEEAALEDFVEAQRLEPLIAGELGEMWMRRGEAKKAIETI
jgi:tetratricopeptide (TPR) repeat protein